MEGEKVSKIWINWIILYEQTGNRDIVAPWKFLALHTQSHVKPPVV